MMHHEVRDARRKLRHVVKTIDKSLHIVERNINESVTGLSAMSCEASSPVPLLLFSLHRAFERVECE